MTIAIDRQARHVTLTMPGYIDKLLRRVKPEGTKGGSTPTIYTPPNYASAGAQRATMDTSPPVPEAEKRYLQRVIGTLLYYSRAVDHTICFCYPCSVLPRLVIAYLSLTPYRTRVLTYQQCDDV